MQESLCTSPIIGLRLEWFTFRNLQVLNKGANTIASPGELIQFAQIRTSPRNPRPCNLPTNDRGLPRVLQVVTGQVQERVWRGQTLQNCYSTLWRPLGTTMLWEHPSTLGDLLHQKDPASMAQPQRVLGIIYAVVNPPHCRGLNSFAPKQILVCTLIDVEGLELQRLGDDVE